MLPESEAPPLENLDRFREYAATRGMEVKRIYDWGGEFEDEDGELFVVEPRWVLHLVKEKFIGDKVYVNVLDMRDADVVRAWEDQWRVLCDLNDAGFERVLEEHGVA